MKPSDGQLMPTQEPWNCAHADAELRARRIANGGLQYRRQCLECGQSVGNAVPHKDVAVPPPEWDDTLHAQWSQKQEVMRLAKRSDEHATWLQAHSEYLLSDTWRAKRRAVLKRDDHFCQGCLQAPATEVHHLTYANYGDEFLFELISLCQPCHERVHEEKTTPASEAGA